MGKFREATKNQPKHLLRHKAMLVHQKSTIRYIKALEPKLHRIALSGPYDYPKLIELLGLIKVDNEGNRRSGSYAAWGFCYLPSTPPVKLTVFFNRKPQYIPKCVLELTCPHRQEKETLELLDRLLPGLKVSSLEYTIDFVTVDPDSAAMLFYFVRRYIHSPYNRKMTQHGGKKHESLRAGKVEVVYSNRTLNLASFFKIYERGFDPEKGTAVPKGWASDQLKQVRFEITADRKYNKLSQYGIDTLADLIKKPNFGLVFKNKIRFSKAKETTKLLPQEWERYKTVCVVQAEYVVKRLKANRPLKHPQAKLLIRVVRQRGLSGTFSSEFQAAKQRHSPYKAIEPAIQFQPIEQAIALAARWFDSNWQRKRAAPSLPTAFYDAEIC